ncbi:hypothetical protein [Ruegeria profundi]|uniref:hypothetical protein n=1 Tax=Ruegeria profundi TaxID=1685378 RepID=UPI001CD41630|nr:hypothetical protein [Ruegeria profundi]MCA0928803.1 hypothetical protein [Ruegeria profundi]
MLNFLKVSVSALVLSAFVVAPIVTVFATDYAYAKNGNGKGGGNGGGKGDNGGGKGGNGGEKGAKRGWGPDKTLNGAKTKSASKSHKSKSGSRLGRAMKEDIQALGRNLKQNGVKGLFKGNKVQTTKTRTNKAIVKQSPRPPSRKAKFLDDGTLAPRNLGKLNGAINSSVNAKLAHIANGQYAKGSGPVSLAAGLAVADANFNHVMGEDYDLSPEEVKEIAAAYDYLETAPMTLEEAEQVLADEAATPGAIAPEDLETAQAVKDAHDVTTDEDGNKIGQPTDGQLAAAEAVHDAEASLLGHYKGDFSEDRIVAEEQQDRVLGAVRASNPDEESVKSTLGTSVDGSIYADEHEDDDAEG